MDIEYTSEFKRNLRQLAKRYRSIRQDIEPLIEHLKAGQTPGDQMPRVGYSVYKVRIKNSDSQRGKSGGYRVIYYRQTENKTILVTLYSKTDQSDIDSDTIQRIVKKHEEK